MTKREFLNLLNDRLSVLPKNEIDDRLSFYSEIINDRIGEGLSEEDAVSSISSVDEIFAQAISDIPLTKIAAKRIKPKRRLRVWEIVLLSLGSPIWVSLSIAIIAVILSLYISLWSIIISLWSVFVSLVAASIAGISGLLFAATGHVPTSIAVMAVGIVCIGLSIYAFFGCKAATKGVLILTKKIAAGIKKCFIKKEATL